ncbi:MAG: sel1 repeat family protein [Desulfovibrio sp.]|nr:sel1 repeat family protein [Desulfovibrio sp.]
MATSEPTYENLTELAGQGDGDAQFRLGVMYENGQDVPLVFEKALSWYMRAASQGNKYAQHNLGMMHELGRGVPQDFAKALSWYRRAAVKGCAYAQYALGAMHDNGRGVPQDSAKAFSCFRQAALQGYADAQHALGVAYESGRGVPQDFAKALSWYRRASAKGCARAQHNLGVMHENGRGVPQDFAKALSWYRRAAAKGYARAQHNLGVMHENQAMLREVPQPEMRAEHTPPARGEVPEPPWEGAVPPDAARRCAACRRPSGKPCAGCSQVLAKRPQDAAVRRRQAAWASREAFPASCPVKCRETVRLPGCGRAGIRSAPLRVAAVAQLPVALRTRVMAAAEAASPSCVMVVYISRSCVPSLKCAYVPLASPSFQPVPSLYAASVIASALPSLSLSARLMP